MSTTHPRRVKVDGEIVARRLDGVVSAASPLEASEARITYDIMVINSGINIAASLCQNLRPIGRPSLDVDVRAAEVGDPCEVYITSAGGVRIKVAESALAEDC